MKITVAMGVNICAALVFAAWVGVCEHILLMDGLQGLLELLSMLYTTWEPAMRKVPAYQTRHHL